MNKQFSDKNLIKDFVYKNNFYKNIVIAVTLQGHVSQHLGKHKNILLSIWKRLKNFAKYMVLIQN